MTRPKAKVDLMATRLAERNAPIIERIRAGEKRYMLAEEFNLSPMQLSRISKQAGLPRWSRFKRQVNN